MSIDDKTMDNAWESWARVWDPKDRDQGAWQFALKDLSNEQFREAARLALTACRFFPSPNDIWKLAPPPERDFKRASAIPEGWRAIDSMSAGQLKSHCRTCEEWFAALQGACEGGPLVDPTSNETIANGPAEREGFLAVAKKLVAVQHIRCKEGENLLESFTDEQHGPDPNVDGDQGVLDMESGVLGPQCEEEVRSVGVRRDRSPWDEASAFGADDITNAGVNTEEKDVGGDTTVGVGDVGRDSGDPRVGQPREEKPKHGTTCCCPACEADYAKREGL